MINLKNKRLYRRPNDALILGIAAGIGHYLEVDPVFVRMVWLAAAAVTHVWPMAVLYIALFFVVPIEPSQERVPSHQEPKDVTPEPVQAPTSPVERMDGDQNM